VPSAQAAARVCKARQAPRDSVCLVHGREHNAGGLGLGPGIARSIVQAQGGQLVLANHPEGGLEATVRLPASVASPSSEPKAPAPGST
jgi:K+-sensing histidine kinase KdpD